MRGEDSLDRRAGIRVPDHQDGVDAFVSRYDPPLVATHRTACYDIAVAWSKTLAFGFQELFPIFQYLVEWFDDGIHSRK